MNVFVIVEWRCSCSLVAKWRVIIPLYEQFASPGQLNLYTALDNKAVGVEHFS